MFRGYFRDSFEGEVEDVWVLLFWVCRERSFLVIWGFVWFFRFLVGGIVIGLSLNISFCFRERLRLRVEIYVV